MTSKDLQDLQDLGIIDEIIPAPLGVAHRHIQETADSIAEALKRYIDELRENSFDVLLEERYQKFRLIGGLQEEGA